jgi:histidinol-phosphate aminotransferase
LNTQDWQTGLYSGKPYTSGEQPKSPGLVKLNSNENPYPPSPGALLALAEFASAGGNLRLYPPSDGGILREALAAYHGVGKENLFLGNGSDEVLALAFRACFGTKNPVLFADITYSFYPVWCNLFSIPFETVAVADDFRIRVSDYRRRNGGIVLCNPNAPTGIGEESAFVRALLDANRGSVVIVDEAYADFAEWSAVSLTREYPNLLVTKSFSKSRSLAGMRIGCAIGSKRLVEALATVKDSFNSYPLDSVSLAVGAAAVADEAYYRQTVAKVKAVREDTADRLRQFGFDVPQSRANFLFVGCGSAERAKELFAFLRERNILARYFGAPRTADRLRVSIGTAEEMQALLACARAFAGQ